MSNELATATRRILEFIEAEVAAVERKGLEKGKPQKCRKSHALRWRDSNRIRYQAIAPEEVPLAAEAHQRYCWAKRWRTVLRSLDRMLDQ